MTNDQNRSDELQRQAESVREFNRIYTRLIGVLDRNYLSSRLSLTEVRILYELEINQDLTASDLTRMLGLDSGYVSRILSRFRHAGWVDASVSTLDRRRQILSITPDGRSTILPLLNRAQQQIAGLLDDMSPVRRARLVGALAEARQALSGEDDAIEIRGHRPGDLGWSVAAHGRLYATEYGWDETFEAMVAGIAAGFLNGNDPAREACWIADRGGEAVGSVMLVAQSDTVAQLRLLIIDPSARGHRLGYRLVDTCLDFARACGYAQVTLTTYDCLAAARRIYQSRGFRLVDSGPEHSFGADLTGERWDLDL